MEEIVPNEINKVSVESIIESAQQIKKADSPTLVDKKSSMSLLLVTGLLMRI